MTGSVGPARGLLHTAVGPGEFHHARLAPSPMLAPWIAHYWSVRWDLRGHPPQRRETLPHPNVHWVFDADGSRIHGIHGGRFTVRLEDRGEVFGLKFRPGGFRPFLTHAVARLRNRSLPPVQVFGAAATALENEILSLASDAQRTARLEAFLQLRLPPHDPQVDYVARIVAEVEHDRRLVTVAALENHCGQPRRALQRLFNEYVGVGPKWVIQRYRLHEALARIAEGAVPDWAALALELGYFDQAHFIRDFTALVGRPPAHYARLDAPA
jgi:AraC-like DNA-binding protein